MKLDKIVLIEPEALSEHSYGASRMPRLGLSLLDTILKEQGIRFATDKSIESFSRRLNSLGEWARRLKVTGRVEDGIESIADFYDSAIPRFELVYD